MHANLIPVAKPSIGEAEALAVYEVIKSGWISMGPKVQEFEESVAAYVGCKYVVAMNNGTSTLHALMMALNIGPGDEVIVPSLTYISAVNVILYQGATPVLCDSDPNTFNTSAELVLEKVTERTKAILTVDMKGQPVDYDSLLASCNSRGIYLLSDSAESLGAIYKGEKVGKQVLAHSFSMFANKNITTGEGGFITTNDESLYHELLVIRNQGQQSRYTHIRLGNNFRMTDIQAAIGIQQLEKLEGIMDQKVKVAQVYEKHFDPTDLIQTPKLPDFVCRPSWYAYSIKVPAVLRDLLCGYLDKNGVETRLSFPPVHTQPYHRANILFNEKTLTGADSAFMSFVDIPIWAGMTDKEITFVHELIVAFVEMSKGGLSATSHD